MTVHQQPILESTEPDRVSDRVLQRIADVSGTSSLESDQRLYDVIDPDALDRLFRDDGIDGRLEFSFAGYRITVEGKGEVAIAEERT